MKQFILMTLLLFLLLSFHESVITGTQNGLLLWYQTLVPSLLPFILITNALSETNAYESAISLFKKKNPGRIYEIIAILLGNLCGYPIGGKILNDFVNRGCIPANKANRLIALSSQTSPMFLLGYVYTHIMNRELPLYIFIISIYLPVFVYYMLFCIFTNNQSGRLYCASIKKIQIKDTFLHTVEIMVIIGVYVIIFSILISILQPLCKYTMTNILLSFLEITTGLNLLSSISLSESLRLSLICALSAFGGLCSSMQVQSVIDYSTSTLKKYLLDKCILSAGTFCIIYLYCLYS